MIYNLLLIEDDSGIATSLKSGLEREGYGVYWAETGTEGITYLRDYQSHLIILDIRLPDGSGFDFCREIRQQNFKQPIIMLTVQHDEMDKILGLEMGADDYVTKPFSLRELLSRVRAQLRRAYGTLAMADGNMVYIGDLAINRESGQVFQGDREINLSPTEFRLLVYMAQHRTQALSRGQILEAVWGYDADLETGDVVKVTMRRLREKIEPDPGKPQLILTVPGIGYRLR